LKWSLNTSAWSGTSLIQHKVIDMVVGVDWGVRNAVTVVTSGGLILYRKRGVGLDPEKVAAEIVRLLPRGSIIAVEDLKGIRGRVHTSKARYLPYGKLQSHLKEFAKQAGMGLVKVKAAWTSTTCPRCLCRSKFNRIQEVFKCLRCGFVADADIVGAWNVARRAASSMRGGQR